MLHQQLIVKKEFLLLTGLISLIYFALELYYHFYISDQFSYMRYDWDLNIFKYILTKVVFLLLLAGSLNVYRRSGFLYSIFLLLLFFFYIPNAILFSFGDFPVGPFVANTFFVSCFLLAPYIRFRIPDWSIPEKLRGISLFSIALLLLVPIILTFGSEINLKTLFLSEIYETRALFQEKMTGSLAYLYNFEAKTLIPVALVFFMINRRWFLIVLSILALLYLFVISGNKLVYFTSIIVVFFYYIGRGHVSKLGNFFLIVLVCFALFPLIDAFVLTEPIFSGTFVNRFVFIPALTTQFYFDFFDGNPFYFAESHFFNLFVTSPYDMPVGFLITKEYWNEPTAYASNGIVSDGFMNLGYAGVFIFSIVFTILFGFFNRAGLNKGFFGLFFCYVYLFLSVQFLSAFVTGGILIFIMLLLFILRQKQADAHST